MTDGDRRTSSAPLKVAAGRLAPVFILATFAIAMAVIVTVGGETVGYDSDAYVTAGQNVLGGRPLYDPDLAFAVGHAVFLYPPAVAIAFVPLALAPASVATLAWLAIIVAALLLAIALMPVRASVRWATLLLAAVSFPTVYSIKLGQVGPILVLALVVGWRWLDRPVALGASIAFGALIKVQPLLLFGWALVTRRWAAVAVGLALLALAVGISTLVVGPNAWVDYVRVLLAISKPVTTPQNVTPGAVAYQAGLSEGAATAIQAGAMVLTLLVAVFAWLRAGGETSYIVTVAAYQLLSPVLWTHYAIVLLIPTAFLLQRRQWWAAAIPLLPWAAIALPLLPWAGAAVVLLGFVLGLVGPLLVDGQASRAATRVRLQGAPTGA